MIFINAVEIDFSRGDSFDEFIAAQEVFLAAEGGVKNCAPGESRDRGSSFEFINGTCFQGVLSLLLGVAKNHSCIVQLGRQFSQFLIERCCNGDGTACLVDLKVFTTSELGDLLPVFPCRRILSALNRVDHDAFLQSPPDSDRILDVILVVHVCRCIADEKHHPVGIIILAPGNIMHRIVQRLINTFRTVTTTISLKIHQGGIHAIEIVGQIDGLCDVGIATVPISNKAHFDIGCDLCRRHGTGDRPDFFLGSINQATHTTGRVEHKDHLDPWLFVDNGIDDRQVYYGVVTEQVRTDALVSRVGNHSSGGHSE